MGMCFRAPFMDGVAFHDPMHEATKKPLTTVAACHCSPYSPGRQSRPHLFHVVRKVCTKSGHVSTIPPVVKNNSHHGISTIKSDYPLSIPSALLNPDKKRAASTTCASKRLFVFVGLRSCLPVRRDRSQRAVRGESARSSPRRAPRREGEAHRRCRAPRPRRQPCGCAS